MILSDKELACVKQQMNTYHITYQEIYDELTDHMISAVEDARLNGDDRNVALIFQEVVAMQFPGERAFQKLTLKYVKAYGIRIRNVMRTNYSYYLNWQTIALIMAFCAVSFYLPATRVIPDVCLGLLIIATFYPWLYVITKLRIKVTGTKRQSLLKSFILSHSQFLFILTSFLLYVPRFFSKSWQTYFNPAGFPPIVFVLLLSFFTIYGLSAMRLCRQEMKLDSN